MFGVEHIVKQNLVKIDEILVRFLTRIVQVPG